MKRIYIVFEFIVFLTFTFLLLRSSVYAQFICMDYQSGTNECIEGCGTNSTGGCEARDTDGDGVNTTFCSPDHQICQYNDTPRTVCYAGGCVTYPKGCWTVSEISGRSCVKENGLCVLSSEFVPCGSTSGACNWSGVGDEIACTEGAVTKDNCTGNCPAGFECRCNTDLGCNCRESSSSPGNYSLINWVGNGSDWVSGNVGPACSLAGVAFSSLSPGNIAFRGGGGLTTFHSACNSNVPAVNYSQAPASVIMENPANPGSCFAFDPGNASDNLQITNAPSPSSAAVYSFCEVTATLGVSGTTAQGAVCSTATTALSSLDQEGWFQVIGGDVVAAGGDHVLKDRVQSFAKMA
jgi:hypothetical protein